MRVLRGFKRSAGAATVVTLGNFDGVHRGHAALLERLAAHAEKLNAQPTVVTFEPHPREFFSQKEVPARLTPLREKLEYFAQMGVAQTCVIRFDRDFSTISAEGFAQKVLKDCLLARHVMIGDDFRFGYGRQGDFAFLKEAGLLLGFDVEAMPAFCMAGQRVSSSLIRQALEQGNMEKAALFLGRPYAMCGRVVQGSQLGRKLGFATANIYVRHMPLPLKGVFAIRVAGVGDKLVAGVANLGTRPTVGGGERCLLEAHLFDFHGNLYGAHLSVQFLHKLRDEARFPDIFALKDQISRDVVAARAFFDLER